MIIKKILFAAIYTLLGSLFGIVSIYVYLQQNRSDLDIWHVIELQNEYTVETSPEIISFRDYLKLEQRLFDELDEKIYQPNTTSLHILRYEAGSISDPNNYEQNWNRSFELPQKNAKGGIFLLHGLSDSPYSLRTLAKSLHDEGYYVLGLRMPGHGTIPSALKNIRWQDMAAAVRIAAKHLSSQINKSAEFHIIGYSMGAAQAVNYSLDALLDRSLPQAKSLVLISPAIGVSPAAALAIWQSRLSVIPGLEKLAWNSIGPEYDPYKYVSFAVNAGDVMYRLTNALASKLDDEAYSVHFSKFPAILAFLSVVDATTSVRAVDTGLMRKFNNSNNKLVIFDINRNTAILPFLRKDPAEGIRKLMSTTDLGFNVSLLTNSSTDSLYLKETQLDTFGTIVERNLDRVWPANVYSLSHVALPFPASDSLYGNKPEPGPGLNLGLLAARGERGVLRISAKEMLRIKYNPFYSYLDETTKDFIQQ